MRVAISNLAWEVEEDPQVAPLLRRFGVDAIDIALARYFPDPCAASARDIAGVRGYWARCGVEIFGVQSLLFGAGRLNVFGPDEERAAILRRLSSACRIAAGLGAARLVFGSYRNRDRAGLSDEEAMDVAVRFFRRLGDVAQPHGVAICLEAIPARYGANFMTTTAEAAKVVAATSHPSIRLQLDTGTMAVNGEDAARVTSDFGALIAHVHASEPDLAPFGAGGADHATVARTLARKLPGLVVTVEMLPPPKETRLASIERALAAALRIYRESGPA